jgi:hypothetical protein
LKFASEDSSNYSIAYDCRGIERSRHRSDSQTLHQKCISEWQSFELNVDVSAIARDALDEGKSIPPIVSRFHYYEQTSRWRGREQLMEWSIQLTETDRLKLAIFYCKRSPSPKPNARDQIRFTIICDIE